MFMRSHRVGCNQKHYHQSTNAVQKSIETLFSIATCLHCGDKWQSKTMFLLNFDLRFSIVLVFLIAAYLVWRWLYVLISNMRNISL